MSYTSLADGGSVAVSLAKGWVIRTTGNGLATLGPGPMNGQTRQLQGKAVVGPFDYAATVYLTGAASLSYEASDPTDIGTVTAAQAAAVSTMAGASSVTFPTATPTATDSGIAGNLTGTYYYTVFFYTANGRTDITTAAPTPVTVSGKKVNLTGIPVSSDPAVIGRGICRNQAADGNSNSFPRQWIVALIPDNTTTTYQDNTADGSLTLAAPRVSTISGYLTSGGARVGNFYGISQGLGQNTLAGGTGYANVMIGANTGQAIVNAMRNTSVGVLSMAALTSGDQNTGLGTHALGAAVSTVNSTAVGFASAGNFIGTGTQYVTAVGCFSAAALTTGSGCTAVGYNALTQATTGYNNTVVGEAAGSGITTGAGNSLVGLYAGQVLNSNFNVAVGMQALTASAVGGSNVALGVQAGAATTGGNGVFIGFQAGQFETAGNSFYVDSYGRADINDAKAKALMYGTFASTADAQRLRINALTGPAKLTTAQRPAWSSALEGFMYYDLTLHKLVVAGASAWETVTSA